MKHLIELPKATKTRFAVLDYHGGSNTLIRFNDFKDEQKLKNRIDTLSWKGDADSVDSLFIKALELFDENRKSRKVLVLFINDGLNVDLNALRNSARKLNEREVKVVVVAIGDRVRNEEIGAITSGLVVRGKITESVAGVGDRTGTEVLKGNWLVYVCIQGCRVRDRLDTHAPRGTLETFLIGHLKFPCFIRKWNTYDKYGIILNLFYKEIFFLPFFRSLWCRALCLPWQLQCPYR